jgi:hypothetical protein
MSTTDNATQIAAANERTAAAEAEAEQFRRTFAAQDRAKRRDELRKLATDDPTEFNRQMDAGEIPSDALGA